MNLLETRTGQWVTTPDGGHVSVCRYPPDPRERMVAMRMLFVRYLYRTGVIQERRLELCPCGYEDDPCACERDERIAYERKLS